MALTKWERKERLGHGAVKEIAQATQRSEGHVSQVINGKRRDRVVEVAAARRLQMPVDEVFEPVQQKAVA
jgi:hypothetical protein